MTKNKEDSNNWDVDEHGLPLPKRYDAPPWDVREYLTDTYAEAKTLGEAIEMRGQDAFVHEVDPADFSDDGEPFETKIGIAELWAESTWREGISKRDIELERAVATIQAGDLIEIRACPATQDELGFQFCLPNGEPLPYSPYHDYDEQFLNRAFKGCRAHEHLVCRVRSVECYGGNNDAPVDPLFCWRVYTCKVTVFRRNWEPELN